MNKYVYEADDDTGKVVHFSAETDTAAIAKALALCHDRDLCLATVARVQPKVPDGVRPQSEVIAYGYATTFGVPADSKVQKLYRGIQCPGWVDGKQCPTRFQFNFNQYYEGFHRLANPERQDVTVEEGTIKVEPVVEKIRGKDSDLICCPDCGTLLTIIYDPEGDNVWFDNQNWSDVNWEAPDNRYEGPCW